MTIKQLGGVFGRNPTFNNVTIDGELIINGSVFTGLDYEGAWNADTNTPTLTSSVGTLGQFYIVSVAGATDLNGITNWDVGDWALFNGSVWQRVEGGADGNFSTLSVSGLSSLNGGANVTGSVTVTGDTIKIDSATHAFYTADRGDTSSYAINRYYTAGTESWRVGLLNDGTSNFHIYDVAGSADRLLIGTNGDISFYNAAGTSQSLFWDASAESLGIGTSLPDGTLHVQTASAGSVTADTAADDLVVENSTHGGISILTPNSVTGAIYFGDPEDNNAGRILYNHGDDSLTFMTDALGNGGAGAMTIDSSRNVGIGTSSPARKLEISGGHARLSDGYNLEWGGGTNYIRGSSASNYVFVATNSTERLRIDASGNLLVGKTAASSNTVGFETSADGTCAITRSGAQPLLLNRQSGVGGDIILLRKDGATVGSISVTASATAYNTSSDQRLKDNIVDADDAGSKIDAIQVRKFDWKVDGSHQDYGMVAQELLEVAPEAVSQGETEDDMMAVDYSKLVPMMLKEIQSLRARIAALES